MVGRKPKAKIRKPNAYLPIDIYTISYDPEFVRSSKKEIRDADEKILFSSRQLKITDNRVFTKEQLEILVPQLKKLGYRNVKVNQQRRDLPSKCPNCKRNGTPAIIEDKRYELVRTKHRLNYNHSSSPKTCYVGTVDFTGVTQIRLKKGLPMNSLGYRRRVGIYPL